VDSAEAFSRRFRAALMAVPMPVQPAHLFPAGAASAGLELEFFAELRGAPVRNHRLQVSHLSHDALLVKLGP